MKIDKAAQFSIIFPSNIVKLSLELFMVNSQLNFWREEGI
jgi:hypothetical protein